MGKGNRIAMASMDGSGIMAELEEQRSLFDQVADFSNLLLAYRKAARGKRFHEDVATFDYHLEGQLLRLRDELRSERYVPGAYRRFTIADPR